ncbi:hypothetical protein [Embleya sp. NPDC005971]|uniref:hypothetical protein n=1 Tax=Embleya sp. NPDC005971 TaxID=3156724 RepID=UPI0033F82B5D
MSEIFGLIGTLAAVSVTGVCGWFTLRATNRAAQATAEAQRAAAEITAEPARDQVSLSILKETTERVDRENGELRQRLSRLESVLRAFSRSADRWCAQMRRAGIDPEPPDPLVEEYHRTGV